MLTTFCIVTNRRLISGLAVTLLLMAGLPAQDRSGEARTVIEAQQSTYDSEKNQVRFEGGVILEQPTFKIHCDELVADMVAEARSSVIPQASGIRSATASGDVVIQRFLPDGTEKRAISKRARYDSATGLIILSVYPKIKDGQQIIEGTSESTQIFLTENGEHQVKGPSTIKFIPSGGKAEGFDLPDQTSLLNLDN